MCDSSQNLRFHNHRPKKTIKRAHGDFATNRNRHDFHDFERTVSVAQNLQADKIFRETWSKSRTEANCP